jgi:methylated-DNA-protein-cysteine methyltransferase related protein
MFERVLGIVRQIPRGKVATYGDVAKAAGYPGAARQVVWALRSGGKGVPWHRVLGAKGRILLLGTNGLEQRLRLRSEGVMIQGDRVDLNEFGYLFKPVRVKRKSAQVRKTPDTKLKRGKS